MNLQGIKPGASPIFLNKTEGKHCATFLLFYFLINFIILVSNERFLNKLSRDTLKTKMKQVQVLKFLSQSLSFFPWKPHSQIRWEKHFALTRTLEADPNFPIMFPEKERKERKCNYILFGEWLF
jgi:hypothetical protein